MLQPAKASNRLIALCTIVLLTTLFFGLKPKGYRFINQVIWSEKNNRLAFINIGMIYSQKPLSALGSGTDFCISLAVSPYRTGRRLSRIAAIVNKQGRELFTIDQWITGIEVSLWDGQGKRITRIGLSGVLSRDSLRSISAGLNHQELWLYGGKGEIVSRSLAGKQYPAFSDGRLLLGMSATGQNPWRGEFAGCTVTTQPILGDSLSTLLSHAIETGATTPKDLASLSALFFFKTNPGRCVADLAGNDWNLTIPRFPKIFRREGFEILPRVLKLDRSLGADIVVNFLGFIPFGICFYLLFIGLPPLRKKALLVTVISALFVSFGIELFQFFIPTRTSQLMDVFLNGAGAWGGVKVATFLKNRTELFHRLYTIFV